MKKTILSIATVAIAGLTLTGCGGVSPKPEAENSKPFDVYTNFKNDIKKYKGELDESWVKNPYKNPFIKNKNPKYFLVRNVKVDYTFIKPRNSAHLRLFLLSQRRWSDSGFSFKVAYPCNSIIECKAMIPSQKAQTAYAPEFDHRLTDKEKKDMAVPAIEYDKALLYVSQVDLNINDLKTVNKAYDDYFGFTQLELMDGGTVVKAEDYNSTHDKDMLNIIKKMKIERKLDGEVLKYYNIQTKDHVEFFNKLTDQILLDWSEAKPFYKQRIAQLKKAEAERLAKEKAEAERLAKEKARKAKLAKYKEMKRKQREAKLKALREQEGI